jgi:DHA3 family multidrug efflux protein-like MFS transporter
MDQHAKNRFLAILANSLSASLSNTFVWFAITFWAYLETQSVIVTSVMAGIYTVTTALSGFVLGHMVDRYPKKRVMLISSGSSLILYGLAALLYLSTPAEAFKDVASVPLWGLILLALAGALVGNLRGIALSTLVTLMVPEPERDRSNGLIGTINGVAFFASSIFSGLAIGFAGMWWVLLIGIGLTALVVLHLWTLHIPDAAQPTDTTSESAHAGGVDLRGTIYAIRLVPGLFPMIFFHTFNNFLGGVFMSLMDAYGLQLVSVQVWGTLWGFISLGFIVGGLVVARKGLGQNPLRTLFIGNLIMWFICSVFTLRSSIVLTTIGLFIWLCLVPAVEAAEQTILQKLIPLERQGRVFGFAQSVEQAASPLTSFMIGPIAQLIFIPFMTTGAGVTLIGPWFGTGMDRGLALLFSVAGLVGLLATLVAMRSRAYHRLSENYRTSQTLVMDTAESPA